jgi:RNA polymerase sigma-70 factor, ECF subfamily
MGFDYHYYWQKIKSGDEKAFEILFKEVCNSLNYYALQITNDIFLAQEIVQDVFLKLWQNRETIAIRGSLKAYLYQAIHNQAINTKIQGSTKKNAVTKLGTDFFWDFIGETRHMDAFLLENLEANETADLIDKIVKELPEQCQNVFSLSRYENKTNKEIASILNITENTVRTHIYRALEKIEEALEKNI